MNIHNIIIAGFGGQGILFTGKILAYAGLNANKNVSWLPSYGPEMRGGTANCCVCISDYEIASPLVINPQFLVAMNLPSYEKFINTVTVGGMAFIDSSLVDKKHPKEDIDLHYIPATNIAASNDLSGFGNMIMLGKIIKEANILSLRNINLALEQSIPEEKSHLLNKNLQAINIGFDL